MTKRVIVVPRGKKKFAVLVDYIQRGSEYGCKVTAEAEAAKIREKKLW